MPLPAIVGMVYIVAPVRKSFSRGTKQACPCLLTNVTSAKCV